MKNLHQASKTNNLHEVCALLTVLLYLSNSQSVTSACVCRYITVLYYLNQPEAGGETAFPAADVESFNETVRLPLYNTTMI